MTAGYPSPPRRVTVPLCLAGSGELLPEPCPVELTETKQKQIPISFGPRSTLAAAISQGQFPDWQYGKSPPRRARQSPRNIAPMHSGLNHSGSSASRQQRARDIKVAVAAPLLTSNMPV